MKAAGIIQARMGSSRLPGKALMEVGGRPMLGLVIERLRRSARLEDIVVATSGEDEDDAIAALCMDMDAAVARGSKSDVLGRFAAACALTDADVIVRVTADCPFIDAGLIDTGLSAWAPGIDRLSAGHDSGYPLGVNAEIVAGRFEEALPRILQGLTGGLDMAWVDGHHRRDATLRYFESIRTRLNEGAIVAFDDIRWSEEMRETWRVLGGADGFADTVDLGPIGLGVWQRAGTVPRRHDLRAIHGRPRWLGASGDRVRSGSR
jgi:CTP:molybdopterin cytidylyltransferase MocA